MALLFSKSYDHFFNANSKCSKNNLIVKGTSQSTQLSYYDEDLNNLMSDDTYFNIGESLGLEPDDNTNFDQLCKVCKMYGVLGYTYAVLLFNQIDKTYYCWYNEIDDNICGADASAFFVIRNNTIGKLSFAELLEKYVDFNCRRGYHVVQFITDPRDYNSILISKKYNTEQEAYEHRKHEKKEYDLENLNRTDFTTHDIIEFRVEHSSENGEMMFDNIQI